MDSYLGSAERRRILRAGAGSVLGALAGGLLGSSRVATAQPLTGPVPEVDRVAIRVSQDSYLHLFEQSRKIGDVQVQRVGQILPKDKSNPRVLLNEWGLSLHLSPGREPKRGRS